MSGYRSLIFTTVKSFARRIKQDNTTKQTLLLLQSVYTGLWFRGKLDSCYMCHQPSTINHQPSTINNHHLHLHHHHHCYWYHCHHLNIYITPLGPVFLCCCYALYLFVLHIVCLLLLVCQWCLLYFFTLCSSMGACHLRQLYFLLYKSRIEHISYS